MRLDPKSGEHGFTLVEVLLAIVVCVIFGTAAFATNSQLLAALKTQKETTAATMLLQRRMEDLRASAWRDVATASFLKTAIIANPAPTNPNLSAEQIAAYVAATKNSEAPLADLSENITVSVYSPDNATPSATPSAKVERNSANPGGKILSWISNNPAETSDTVYSYLTNKPASLLRVDILLSWKGTGARVDRRSRQISSIFGIGNSAP